MNGTKKNVVLIGARGSGKTTVGAILAGRLHREFIPIDALIVYEARMTIPQLVETYGWSYFRRIECKVTQQVSQLKGIINATGGGTVLASANVRALRATGIVFLLDVSLENILLRIGEAPNRPLLTGQVSWREDMMVTLAERKEIYRGAADYVINTNHKCQEQVADEIVRILQAQHGFEIPTYT